MNIRAIPDGLQLELRRSVHCKQRALRQIFQRDGVLGRVEIRVEVIDAEFVEVAEHDVARAIGHEARPIIERLTVMFLEVLAALFHFDQHDGFPDQIGEGGAATVIFDPLFENGPGLLGSAVTEGLEFLRVRHRTSFAGTGGGCQQ